MWDRALIPQPIVELSVVQHPSNSELLLQFGLAIAFLLRPHDADHQQLAHEPTERVSRYYRSYYSVLFRSAVKGAHANQRPSFFGNFTLATKLANAASFRLNFPRPSVVAARTHSITS